MATECQNYLVSFVPNWPHDEVIGLAKRESTKQQEDLVERLKISYPLKSF